MTSYVSRPIALDRAWLARVRSAARLLFWTMLLGSSLLHVLRSSHFHRYFDVSSTLTLIHASTPIRVIVDVLLVVGVLLLTVRFPGQAFPRTTNSLRRGLRTILAIEVTRRVALLLWFAIAGPEINNDPVGPDFPGVDLVGVVFQLLPAACVLLSLFYVRDVSRGLQFNGLVSRFLLIACLYPLIPMLRTVTMTLSYSATSATLSWFLSLTVETLSATIWLLTLLYLRRFGRKLACLLASKCPHCDYDLTGNVSGVCPECGTKIERP